MSIYSRFVLIVTISLLFVGCNVSSDSVFAERVYAYTETQDDLISLQGECIVSGQYGITNIEVAGNYLLFTTPRLDTLFHVYTLDGNPVSSFGQKGKGPDDFANCLLNGQTSGDNQEEIFLWINDLSYSKLKRLNVSRSVKEGRCVVDASIPIRPMSTNAFCLGDSCVVQEVMTADNYRLIIEHGQDSVREETLYHPNVASPFSYYKSVARIDPASSLLVSAMYSINLVNFLNCRTMERFSCRVGKAVPLEDIIDVKTGLEKHTYYTDLKITKQSVYVLYMDQPYEDSFEKEKPVEVHIFDKKGGLKSIVRLKEYISNIAITPDESTLYGLEGDSNVYRYQLPASPSGSPSSR